MLVQMDSIQFFLSLRGFLENKYRTEIIAILVRSDIESSSSVLPAFSPLDS
jgi:hypothetical protein